MLTPDLGLLPRALPLIDGRQRERSGGFAQVHCYAATGRPTVEVTLAGPAEVEEAVAGARRAFPAWRALRADQRRQLLLRASQLIAANAERLGAVQTIETGLPRQFAAPLPQRVADHFAYWAGWADKVGGEVMPAWPARALDYATWEPYGVVAAILPWNSSLMSFGQVVAPALATGNTVVVKPSELAPFTALALGELLLEAGLPPGVVQVLPAGPEGSRALASHRAVSKIHFTGSPATARQIVAAAQQPLTPLCLELGGKSALVVFADADPMAAAQQAISGAVVMSGQGCANATRVLVEAPVYDRILRLASGLLRRVPLGDPLLEETVMGPVISAAACERTLDLIGRCHARRVIGGERATQLGDGWFITPALFADVDPGSELAQEEIFGPVVAFFRFETEDQAVELANSTRFGLAAYVHTNDLRRVQRLCASLDAGSIWVNGLDGSPPGAPFGGNRESGYGRIGGTAAVRELTRPKNVWIAG